MGNSHPRTTSSPKNAEIRAPPPIIDAGPQAERTDTAPEESSGERKEKSVLQAKLTKLAIQIGYAGMLYILRRLPLALLRAPKRAHSTLRQISSGRIQKYSKHTSVF